MQLRGNGSDDKSIYFLSITKNKQTNNPDKQTTQNNQTNKQTENKNKKQNKTKEKEKRKHPQLLNTSIRIHLKNKQTNNPTNKQKTKNRMKYGRIVCAHMHVLF